MTVPRSGVQVLLVEDSATTARVIEAMLVMAASEFAVTTVGSLGTAVERLAEGGVNAVLLDLNLPDSSGIQTFERLRDHTDAPIVVLTAIDDEVVALRAIEAGAQDYLVKGSVSGAVLARALRYAVHRSRPGPGLDSERRVTEMLGAASHELRRPLSVIAGYADILVKGTVTDPAIISEAHASIQSAASRAARLVERLIDAGRLSSGQVPQKIGPFSLRAVAESAVAATGGHSRVTIDISADLPAAMTDAEIVADVLTNLVENALKYSDGPCSVEGSVDENGITASVSDHGPGIPSAAQARLFEPFYRAEGTTKSGTGLGLYLVRLMVDSLGGTIEISSELGVGSTFTIRIPPATPD